MLYFKSFLFSITFFLVPFFCVAAEKIVVTPAFQEFALNPNQVSAGEIEIQNQTGTDQQFQVRAVGFHSLDISGGIAFLGSDINNENLFTADFVDFENRDFPVKAGDTRKFLFEVKDQESLAPGGHYAALVFQSLPVSEENSSQKIAVRQIFSALLFIEKTGGATKEIKLTKFSDKSFHWGIPKSLTVHFKNTGNTHATPRGIIRLENAFGKMHSCGILNEASGLLLPNQERVFSTNLKCQAYIPGRYVWHVAYRYDGNEELQEIQQSFWLVPYPLVIAVGVLMALLLILKKRGVFSLKKKQ